MGNGKERRILHAKDSETKIAYFHNEIIKRLVNGERVAVVNMMEFESIFDSRIVYKSIDVISSIQGVQAVFVFEVYPLTTMLETISKLDCGEVNVTVTDYSAMFKESFIKAGFETLYINNDYIESNPVYGSLEELSAAILRTNT